MAEDITRNELDAIVDRINAEDTRQNRRLDNLEQSIQQLQELTASVREMTVSLKNMTSAIDKQGERLDILEQQPSNRWNRLVDGLIGAIAALIASGIVAAIIHYM